METTHVSDPDFSLLQHDPVPAEELIRRGLAWNLCRCTGYWKVINAVKRAAQEISYER